MAEMKEWGKKIKSAIMALYSVAVAWLCAMPVCAADGTAPGEAQVGLLIVLMGGMLVIILAVVISVISTVVSSVAGAVEDEADE